MCCSCSASDFKAITLSGGCSFYFWRMYEFSLFRLTFPPNLLNLATMGIVYWERRRRSFKKDACNQWLREALRRCPGPWEEIVIVCDNAPVHAAVEQVTEEDEFESVNILRLAPQRPAESD